MNITIVRQKKRIVDGLIQKCVAGLRMASDTDILMLVRACAIKIKAEDAIGRAKDAKRGIHDRPIDG